MKEPPKERSAYIAIVGRPNVGKSSLMNRLLGQKVAIVSSKPQTTRTRIMGVLTEGEDQLVFLDTPGLLKPRDRLGEYMVKSVVASVSGVDAALLVVEAGTKISPADRDLVEQFQKLHLPAVLCINKIDLLPNKTDLMAQIATLSELYDFDAVVPASAMDGNGLDDLKQELKKLCMEGGHLFPDDTLTDQPERVLAGEIVREKLLRLLQKEVPHGLAVVVEQLHEREDHSCVDIGATIYCEKENHKGIIIGKGGSMLKKVGTYARQDLEKFYGTKVNLQLWVKVKEDWRNKEAALRSFGFNGDDLLDH
ncbi:MAG: GTPase Era [Clostridiales bacterium]|jgi:GTP-binding protein Era|nr:GTPase Era [Clostridiales bacterium]MCI2161015.1 GTPase Era [Oscillospiraceae bacterium]MCI1961174.1 GTPase Era [Clostridiales bacterium]MCI2021615.1 GTPase Era [Clostridiales bacterium]MCI2026401.1 GTPase Era [Clostridiales bacterium]